MPRIKRPYERVKMNVINQSHRAGHPCLIVLHSTEGHNRTGVGDLRDLGNYFDNPRVQASSHVGVDAEGHSAKYVDDGEKAWTCAGFNSASLNIEQIGFSSQKFWPDAQERKVAKYIAYWTWKYSIPLRKGRVNPTNGAIYRSGILRHSDLGDYGGNHNDPGPGYNLRRVLRLARYYRKVGVR
jgi:N-acetyl-anhydromuramyl-L-alanine amidase AmpD